MNEPFNANFILGVIMSFVALLMAILSFFIKNQFEKFSKKIDDFDKHKILCLDKYKQKEDCEKCRKQIESKIDRIDLRLENLNKDSRRSYRMNLK